VDVERGAARSGDVHETRRRRAGRRSASRNPVSIAAGTTYVAGYYAPNGHYSAATNGLSSSVASGPLTAIGNSTSGDGVFGVRQLERLPDGHLQSQQLLGRRRLRPGSVGHDDPGTAGAPPTAPVNAAVPLVAGAVTVGHVLTVSDGGWSGARPAMATSGSTARRVAARTSVARRATATRLLRVTRAIALPRS